MKLPKSVLDAYAQKGYLYPVNMERLERCRILAEKHKCSVAQIAMSYIFFSFDERICSRIYDKPGKDEAES